MKKNKLKSLKTVFACVALLPTLALAEGWYNVGKVTRVHSGHGNDYLYFTTETQLPMNTCSTGAGYTYSASESNAQRIYSMLLSAYIAELPVAVYLTGDCLAGRLNINAVQVKKESAAF